MHTITVYKFNELSEDIQTKLIKKKIESNQSDSYLPWADEIMDSLKALIDKTNGAKLKDYSLGLCSHSYIKVELCENAENLTGIRALTWLENNLFDNLRLTRSQYLKNRKLYFSCGYRVGKIKDCPLTGVCFDHDFLDDLKQNIVSGMTLKDSYNSLADTYIRLLQNEYDQYTSESECKEYLLDIDQDYTENGISI